FPIYDLAEDSYLEFVSYTLGGPKYLPDACRERGLTYAAPLKAVLRLVVREREKIGEKVTSTRLVKEIKEQEVFLCELPLMTENGTFIINGAERVVVSQLHRSPGLVFEEDEERSLQSGKKMYVARMIPYRGIWLEFEFDLNNILYARIDRRKKVLATTLLRAMGYTTDEDILKLFYSMEDVAADDLARLKGRITAAPVVDPHTGEILAEANCKIWAVNPEAGEMLIRMEDGESRDPNATYRKIKSAEGAREKEVLCKAVAVKGRVETIRVLILDHPEDGFSIWDTLKSDKSRTEEGALHELHQKLSPTSPATAASTRTLLENLFFNPRKYDLAAVGRYKLNKKLGRSVAQSIRTLTKEDIAETMKALVRLCNGGEGSKDDIDHLGNRRVRSIGELLENQFRIGFARVEKVVRASMGLVDLSTVLPNVLLNTKPLSAAVKSFFASSQLCQFM
ncbi:MAG: DNA-directed RNA polymerase subunit beta, partial [bacterium]